MSPKDKKHRSYLYQACSTFDWHQVHDYCTSLLLLLLVDNNNDEVVGAGDTGSGSSTDSNEVYEQLSYRDQWGNTALHAVCYNHPPADVVPVLLKVSDVAVPPLHLPSLRSKDGSTPLLVACGAGASIQVLRALLAHESRRHVACLPDYMGNSPLAELCSWYEVTRKSTKLTPSSLPLSQIHTPTDLYASFISKLFWDKMMLLLRASTGCKQQHQQDHDNNNDDTEPKHDNGTTEQFVLDRLSLVSHTSPPIFTRLVIRLTTNDHHPSHHRALHNAISTPLSAYPLTKPTEIRQYHTNNSCMVKELLNVMPRAARILVPIQKNDETTATIWRTPLCQAIASNLHWHTIPFKEEDESPQGEEEVCGPVQSLWTCAPESARSRDLITGLYPFMLAATTIIVTDIKETDVGSLRMLDTVYCLLRACPEPVIYSF